MYLTHFQLTLNEAREHATNKWVDAQDFAAHPWMLCRTGDGHASGTRTKSIVTCPACLEKLRTEG